jgi:hypothetical protein
LCATEIAVYLLSITDKSCNVAPLSKWSTKIRPMLRVQATAVTDETTRPSKALAGIR